MLYLSHISLSGESNRITRKLFISISVFQDRPTKDQPTLSSTATITVNIEDADDLVPEFTYRMYFGSVPEDAGAVSFNTVVLLH